MSGCQARTKASEKPASSLGLKLRRLAAGRAAPARPVRRPIGVRVLAQSATPGDEDGGPPNPFRRGFGGYSGLQFAKDGRTLFFRQGRGIYALTVSSGTRDTDRRPGLIEPRTPRFGRLAAGQGKSRIRHDRVTYA